MIVDGHVHIGKSTRLQININGEMLVRIADEIKVDKLCCTDLTALFYDMHEGNRLLYAEMQRFPDRILGYASLHSTRFGTEAIDEIKRCRHDYGMCGLKIYSTPEMSIAESAMIPILETCVELKMPILAHTTPAECEYLLSRVPEVNFIMAHAGGQPYANGDWNRAIMVAQKFPNLYLDTACSTVDAGFVESCVKALGADRVIFGTDVPLLDPWPQLMKINDTQLTEEQRAMVMGEKYLAIDGGKRMIFDANAFIGKWPYWPMRSSASNEVLEELHGCKIERAAICSTRSVFVNWEDGNCETEMAAIKFPKSFVAFACLGTRELSHAYSAEPYRFDDYIRRGFRGIRLYPQHHSYHLLFESFVDEILEDAAMRKWPVVLPLRIIMNWGMPSIDPSVLHEIVTRHSRVTWILAGVNYLYELQMAISLMRRYETVHLETSCVMGYAAVAKLVQQCGHSQVLFGSGAPVQDGAAGLSKILHARIGEDARIAILGANLQRLLGEEK